MTRTACESANHTWHLNASCIGAGSLPQPTCNRYDTGTCIWDNGPPLNDGGACRSHVNAGGLGQPPRYNFGAADDFILHGPDDAPCSIHHIRTWMRMRPTGLDGTSDPDPLWDWIGANVAIFRNVVSAETNFEGPGGILSVPLDNDDVNPTEPARPGSLVYTRYFPVNEGRVTFEYQFGQQGEYGPFCDPPPAGGLETEDVYRVDILVDPPILLNRNTRYWLSVQGVFPFNDGLRNTLQSWWMPSERNTDHRGMSVRTGNPDYEFVDRCHSLADCHAPGSGQCRSGICYSSLRVQTCGSSTDCPSGFECVLGYCETVRKVASWVPNNFDAVPPGYPPNAGNAGNCPGAPPPRTRLDFAFVLNGSPLTEEIVSDECSDAIEVFDGFTPFDNRAALTSEGTVGCGDMGNDLWFRHTATCNGRLTVSVCDSTFDPILAIYGDQTCDPLGPELACDDNTCGAGPSAGVFIRETGLVLIRVGGSYGASGMGTLSIVCEETCGSPLAGDCCVPHDPEIACSNERCCAIVCSTPGEEVCCDNPDIGWDSECVQVASEVPGCHCPCPLTCPSGAIQEAEPCGGNTNAGCLGATPAQFTEIGALTLGANVRGCGTLYAESGVRDTDWWRFRVTDTNGDGEVKLTLNLRGSAPVGAIVVTSPSGTDCLGQGNVIEMLDAVATASCQSRTLTVCVPADADGETYGLLISTFETLGDEELGDPIVDGFGCSSQSLSERNAYSFELRGEDTCPWGACCTCPGGCADGLSEVECRTRQGTFQGEGIECAQVPPEQSCALQSHGCTQAAMITCGQSVEVDLSSANRVPDEHYPCALNGEDIDDSVWFQFQVPPGVTSVRLHTCDSVNPGRDSILAVYRGGCCQQSAPLEALSCSDDVCGFTGRLSSACLGDLVPGETYHVQVSNAHGRINGRYRLTLDCPCSGSCCNPPAGTCEDHVAMEQCASPLQFRDDITCAELNPRCGLGACCAPDGTCQEMAAADCGGCSVHWPGADCGEVVCNPPDTCRFASAIAIPEDRASLGFRSQYAPDTSTFYGRMDDFILSECTPFSCPESEPCGITTLDYVVVHVDHDTVNGCIPGGGASCHDTPADYQGIVVVLADDAGGSPGSPNCVPQCSGPTCEAGSDGDYHAGTGCRAGVVLGAAAGDLLPSAGHYWTFAPLGPSIPGAHIRVHFDPPLSVAPNKKYWLSLAHVVPETGKFSVLWQASPHFNGNPTLGYASTGASGFVANADVRHDMLFMLSGVDRTPGCGSCRLYGDHVEPYCRVDIDDLLCVLNEFSYKGLCPQADQSPCGGNGLIDVDDILSQLDAFVGIYECPHPCPGGACCGDFPNGRNGVECRDMSYVPGGMSRSDCLSSGGTYFCDNSSCPRAECP